MTNNGPFNIDPEDFDRFAKEASDGLRDVVAYLADAVTLFEGYPHPHALVAAWNATGHPRDRANRIQVTNQNRVRATLVDALR